MRKWTERLPAISSMMNLVVHRFILGILILEITCYLTSTSHPSAVAQIHNALTPPETTSHSTAIVSGLKKLRVQLMEEEPEGREVANLRFLAKGWPSKPSKDVDEKQDNYKIFNSDPQANFFHLDPTTGILRIARRIDRDQLCPTFPSCCPRTREEVIPPDVTESDMTSVNTYSIERGGDSMLKHLPECRLDLNIRSDDQYSKIILVLVHIVDLNDNAPVWPQTDRDSKSTADHQMVVHVSENSLVGDSVSLTSAYDADIGTNGIVRYALVPEIAEFSLKWTSELEFMANRVPLEISKSHVLNAGYDTLPTFNAFSASQLPGARHELKLIVKQTLDREVSPFYDLTLISFDGGSPSRNTSIPLHIVITDANDNTPKFQKDTYVVELAENSRPHTPVVQVIAVDLDEGVNSRIKYRFSPLTNPEFVRLFNLDSVTGWIHVQWEINYEQYKVIHLTVEAVDGGQLPRASTCVVEIHVLDENDHAPEIRFEPAYLTNYALVPENEQPGRLVAVFTAIDRDSGDNGRVACQLTEPKQWRFENADEKQIEYLITDPMHTFFKLQYMQVPFSLMYKLTTASVFDREMASRITVWITCSDYGLPPRNSSASVAVRITDVNDARPQFARSMFYHSVREDTPVGTMVFVINATDMDEGDNAELTFWLSGPDMDYFVINENTGQITVRRSLDRETRDSLQFRVHTSDHGTPSLNASVGVLVTITDVNDNPPELEGRVELAIFENHTTSMPVGRLTVKDPDSGRNSEVSFTQLQCLAYPVNNNWSTVTSFGTLRQKDGSALPVEMLYTFFIAKDGRIYLGHAKLDREQYSSYEILVQAEDHGVPRLTASTVVVIHILDVNDNSPYFIYPSSGNNTIYVPRTIRPTSVIAHVLATDADAEENGRIRYSLRADGREELLQLFELNEWSGELRLRVSLDQLNPTMNSPGDAMRKHFGEDYINANQPHRENGTEPIRLKHKKEDMRSSHQANSAYSLLITASDLGTPTLKSSTILRILFSPPFFPPQPTFTHGFHAPEDDNVKKLSKLPDSTQYAKTSTSWLTVRGDFEDDLTGLGVLFGLVVAIGLFVCLVLLLITVLLRRSRKVRSRQQPLSESCAPAHTEGLPYSAYSATFEGNSSTNSRQITDQTCSRYEENSPLVHGTLRYITLPNSMEIH